MPTGSPIWQRYADAVLVREAALCRVVSGVPPRDDAGLFVGDDEIDALLRGLPGLDGPAADVVGRIHAVLDPALQLGERALAGWLRRGDDALAEVARSCRLDEIAARVLALVCAVELDPQRQRTVAYVQDSVQLPRITLAGLRRLLGDDGVRAVAPGAPLVRLGAVTVTDHGPWATRMCALSPQIGWQVLSGGNATVTGLPAGARLIGATVAAGRRRSRSCCWSTVPTRKPAEWRPPNASAAGCCACRSRRHRRSGRIWSARPSPPDRRSCWKSLSRWTGRGALGRPHAGAQLDPVQPLRAADRGAADPPACRDHRARRRRG